MNEIKEKTMSQKKTNRTFKTKQEKVEKLENLKGKLEENLRKTEEMNDGLRKKIKNIDEFYEKNLQQYKDSGNSSSQNNSSNSNKTSIEENNINSTKKNSDDL